MNVALYNIEENVYNTAMMQVSQYHKNIGDKVTQYTPFYHQDYDKIYAFSLFDFTDKGYVTNDMICGGTGFDINSRLPKMIEESDLDYTIFPDCKTSYIWFSRGCIRSCPFCVVKEKEGKIKPVEPKNLNPNGEWISVMDNNFFANPKWRESINQLIQWNQPVDLQGFDIRIFKPEHGEALSKLRLHKQLKFAWDNPREDINDKVIELKEYVKAYKLMCYVLIGYWSTPEEDLYRVETLRELGVDPFVMPFNKSDPYQKRFARWVNHKSIFKTVEWEDYGVKA